MIAIAQRLKPFSHLPGISSSIPGANLIAKVFPTRIELFSAAEKIIISLEITGPVAGFTVQLDLEKDALFIFGRAKEGYFRLRFKAQEKKVELLIEKGFSEGIIIDGKKRFSKEVLFYPMNISYFLPNSWERLSLGSHKKQEIEKLKKEESMKEMLPIFYALSQKMPFLKFKEMGSSLLMKKDLNSFIQAAFSDLFVPRIFDDQYQGLCPIEGKEEDPFFLFTEFRKWIRSFFFLQKEKVLEILPTKLFDAGRMVEVEAFPIGIINFEWRSFTLRRVEIFSLSSEPFFLKSSSEIESFRLCEEGSLEKKRHFVHEPLFLKEKKRYLLDQFHIKK